jgi:hypothetical protein
MLSRTRKFINNKIRLLEIEGKGMNNTQRIIIAVLILAILFSSLSIFISFSAMNLGGQKDISGNAVSSGGRGGVQLVVETSNANNVQGDTGQ